MFQEHTPSIRLCYPWKVPWEYLRPMGRPMGYPTLLKEFSKVRTMILLEGLSMVCESRGNFHRTCHGTSQEIHETNGKSHNRSHGKTCGRTHMIPWEFPYHHVARLMGCLLSCPMEMFMGFNSYGISIYVLLHPLRSHRICRGRTHATFMWIYHGIPLALGSMRRGYLM